MTIAIPEPPEPQRDERLEKTIAELVDRKNELPENSAERAFVIRQLRGLWFSREEAAGIIEDLDPWGGLTAPISSRRAGHCSTGCISIRRRRIVACYFVYSSVEAPRPL